MFGTFYEERPELKERTMLLDDKGKSASYGQFDDFSRRTKSKMKSRSLFFVLCENSIGAVFSYFSALRNCIVPLLLNGNIMNDAIQRKMLTKLIEEYRPEYLALPEPVYHANKSYFSEMCSLWKIESVWGELGYRCFSLEEKAETGKKTPLHQELALLLTTSGSTGSPKLVRLSYKNLSSNAASIASYLELTQSERPVTTLPMNYTYGLSILNSHILVGASVLLTERTLFDKEFWEFVRREQATSFGGVPYTYEILEKLRFTQMELPHLKTMTQAGGKLPLHLHQEFAEYADRNKKRFIVMYGQTEATARMGYLPAHDALERCGSMGIAIPGGRFWLQRDDGSEIEESGVTGELVYEGKNVMLGYAQNREDLSKGDECGGLLYTGDMARRDGDGYYYIEGRKKRFLKLFGSRISLDAAERLLKQEFKNHEFACAGDDSKMIIFVQGEKREGITEEEIAGYLERVLKLNGRIFQIVNIREIPKNEAGKIQYKKLEELL